MRYSRIKFKKHRGDLVVTGQGQTRRGTNYDRDSVREVLKDPSKAALKEAILAGLKQLEDGPITPRP